LRETPDDGGYPLHIHIGAALEERRRSLKRLFFNHNDPVRPAPSACSFEAPQAGFSTRLHQDSFLLIWANIRDLTNLPRHANILPLQGGTHGQS